MEEHLLLSGWAVEPKSCINTEGKNTINMEKEIPILKVNAKKAKRLRYQEINMSSERP